MKLQTIKLLIIVALVFTITSCSTTMYQIYTASSDDVHAKENYLLQQTNSIDIVYDLWSYGGNPGFAVYNKTDKTIYVDLTKSFFVCNGVAYDYFLNREYSASSMLSVSESRKASLSGLFTDYMLNKNYIASAGKTETTNSARTNGLTIKEKYIIAIPANSMKVIAEYSISNKIFSNCDFKTIEEGSISFNEDNSPLRFRNVITYKDANGTEQTEESSFWISEIKNVKDKNECKQVKIEKCDRKEKQTVFIDSAPYRFYMSYQYKESNDYKSSSWHKNDKNKKN